MSGVHHECLLIGHLAQIFHREAVLCPVLEDGAVAAVDDELVGMLCHRGVEVVLDHQHDGRCLLAKGGILLDGAGVHLVGRTEAVHVDATVFFQLFGKLRGQRSVPFLGEVT